MQYYPQCHWSTSSDEDRKQGETFAQVKNTNCFYGFSILSWLRSGKLLNIEAAEALGPREGEERGGRTDENRLPGKIWNIH